MAAVKYGMFITEMKGKIGGTVLQGGRSGGQVHNLGRPPRSTSNITGIANNALAVAVAQWRIFSETEREDWRTLAATVTLLNRFGDSYTPTGYQLFLACCLNAQSIGNTPTINAPAVFEAFPVVSDMTLVVTQSPNVGSLTWTYISGTGTYSLQAFYIGYGSGSSRFIGNTPLKLSLPASETFGTKGIYGVLPLNVINNWAAGNRLFIAWRWVSNNYGNASALNYIDAEII